MGNDADGRVSHHHSFRYNRGNVYIEYFIFFVLRLAT